MPETQSNSHPEIYQPRSPPLCGVFPVWISLQLPRLLSCSNTSPSASVFQINFQIHFDLPLKCQRSQSGRGAEPRQPHCVVYELILIPFRCLHVIQVTTPPAILHLPQFITSTSSFAVDESLSQILILHSVAIPSMRQNSGSWTMRRPYRRAFFAYGPRVPPRINYP